MGLTYPGTRVAQGEENSNERNIKSNNNKNPRTPNLQK